MQVLNEILQDRLESVIFGLAIDELDILGDIVALDQKSV